MAFDMVNVALLVKRLKIMGMPYDLISLKRECVIGIKFYVQVGEDCSTLNSLNYTFVHFKKLMKNSS